LTREKSILEEKGEKPGKEIQEGKVELHDVKIYRACSSRGGGD